MQSDSAPANAATKGSGELTSSYHFSCHICGEPSTEICTYCTKDVCGDHLCIRCRRCSDCCVCESPVSMAGSQP